MKSWFTITNKAESKTAEVYIYGDIGAWGVSAQAFAEAWKSIPAESNILLRIASSGGSVFEGLAIFTLIAQRRSKVTAQVDSIAASMASVVMCAASKVIAAENSWIMIHNAAGGGWGDGDDLRKMAELLDKMRDQIAGIYETRTGKSHDDIVKAMDDETWFTAQEAKEFGLVDEISASVEAAASIDPSRFRHAPQALFGGPHPAVSTNHQANTVSMKSLLKALVEAKLIASADLPDEAAAAAFTAAFATMQANAKASSDRVTELEAKLAKADEKEQAALKARAEAAVASSVTAGRIKDDKDLRAKWVDSYVRDEESTKSMLASLPEAKPQRGVPPLATSTGPTPSDKPRCQSAVEAWGKAGAVILRNSAN